MMRAIPQFNFERGFVPYWNTFCFCMGLSFLSGFIEPVVGYHAIGFIFLAAVILVAAVASRGVVLFAAGLSALCWNFFFIPPRFTFSIASREDQILCVTYFFVALIAGARSRHTKIQALQEAREEILESTAHHEAPTRPSLRRESISLYEVIGSVLRRLGPSFSVQPFSVQIQPNVGLLNIDFILVEQALLKLMEGLAPYPDPANAISISASKHPNGLLMRIESTETSSINKKLLSLAEDVFGKHGGSAETGPRVGGGLFVNLTLPMDKENGF